MHADVNSQTLTVLGVFVRRYSVAARHVCCDQVKLTTLAASIALEDATVHEIVHTRPDSRVTLATIHYVQHYTMNVIIVVGGPLRGLSVLHFLRERSSCSLDMAG